jgi:hypothetical protein
MLNLFIVCCINLLHTAFVYCILHLFLYILITGFVIRVTLRVPSVEHKLLTPLEHLSSPQDFSAVRVSPSLILCAFIYCILHLFIAYRIYLLHAAFIYCMPYLFIAYCIYFCILQMKKVSLKCKKSLKIPCECHQWSINCSPLWST